MSDETKVKKITVGLLFSWIVGILLAISSIGLMTFSFFWGSVNLVLSLLIIPYFSKLLENKARIQISGGIKVVLFIIILVIMTLTTPNTELYDLNSDNLNDVDNIEDNSLLPEEQEEEVDSPEEILKDIPIETQKVIYDDLVNQVEEKGGTEEITTGELAGILIDTADKYDTTQEKLTEILEKGMELEWTVERKDVQPEIEELKLQIGETAKTETLAVTIKSVEKKSSYTYDAFWEESYEIAKDGFVFVIADVEMQNIGADSIYATSTEFSAMDSQGFRYDLGTYYGEDELDWFQELYKGQRIKGKVIFELPKDDDNLKIIFNFGNLFSGTKLASWNVE